MWKSLVSVKNPVCVKYWKDQYFYIKIGVQLAIAAILYYHIFIDIKSDLFYDTTDFIRNYGYPVETHEVRTQNGYIITVHRIPFGVRNDSRTNRPVVLIQHGIMCSSDVWVYSGPQKDLPFILADNGFDVWLGNTRGNYYADRHVNESITKEEYWNFSWHEMGYYDMPAVIDHILNATNQRDLTYIGHSMGSTIFLVMASEKPEYNDKVSFMIGLGPVEVLQRFTTVTQNVLVPAYLGLGRVLKYVNAYQLLPRSIIRTYAINFICRDNMPTHILCRQLAFGLAGESNEQYNATAMTVILSHVPAGSTENQVRHFYDNMVKGKFLKRDFGEEENLRRYNQSEPPEYDLSRISTPISIYYSQNDLLAPVKGIMDLAKKLPNLSGLHKVSLRSFNHFDFTWGLDVNRLLYDHILKEMMDKMKEPKIRREAVVRGKTKRKF